MPPHGVFFFLIIVSLQIPLKEGAGAPGVERNLRQDALKPSAATPFDEAAAVRREQWAALTSFVIRGLTDDVYALARQGTLDTGAPLVGEWQPLEFSALPPFGNIFLFYT